MTSSPSSPRSTATRRTRDLTTAALIVALLAVSAYVTIPLGTVPVTLQVFVVVLASLLLRPGWAAAAMGVYLLMGAAGLPVFSGGLGGFGVLAGPTGGYLIGFAVAATVGSGFRIVLRRRGISQNAADTAAAIADITIIYLLGWMQLSVVANLSPAQAFLAGVAPFLIPDLIKGTVAIAVARGVRRALAGRGLADGGLLGERGQGDGHPRSATGQIGGLDAATMSGHDRANDGKTESGAATRACATRVRSIEAVEEPRQVGFGDSGAVVED